MCRSAPQDQDQDIAAGDADSAAFPEYEWPGDLQSAGSRFVAHPDHANSIECDRCRYTRATAPDVAVSPRSTSANIGLAQHHPFRCGTELRTDQFWNETLFNFLQREERFPLCDDKHRTHFHDGKSVSHKVLESSWPLVIGAVCFHDQFWVRFEKVLSVTAIDSIGAGDNFDAGFLTAYLRGYALEMCTREATPRARFVPRVPVVPSLFAIDQGAKFSSRSTAFSSGSWSIAIRRNAP